MLKNKERLVWISVVVFILCISFFTIYQPSKAKAQELDDDYLNYSRMLNGVYNTLREYYVDPDKATARKLMMGAIKGMLEAVEDPFTMYMDEKLTEELTTEMAGEFGGLGIQLGMNDDGWLMVMAPIEGTPAERAGIRSGDIIAEIEGKSTKGMAIEQAVRILRGKEGTKITISLAREGESEPIKVTLIRAKIIIKSVKTEFITNEGIGYVRLINFGDKTTQELKDSLLSLKSLGMKKLILDLRNNPGGRLDTAQNVADFFLSSGKIVYTRGRDASQSKDAFATAANDICVDTPMIVLVNGYSASASEIVAGALRDNKRAILVGQKTYGKFSVQQVLPIDPKNKVTCKITVAKYFTPGGYSLHKEGLPPNIVVEDEEFSKDEIVAVRHIREGKFIKDYVHTNPVPDKDAIELPKLMQKLTASCIKIRPELVERLIYVERGRANYKKVIDLTYDRQLKEAVSLVKKPDTFDFKKYPLPPLTSTNKDK
ncbi:MAG: S41 family peptidase [Spirochaetota bacterium]